MKAAPSSSHEEVTTWTTNQVVFATIFVVCVFLIFWLLYRLRTVLFLLFVAMVLGTAIRPAVEWLYRRGISRTRGVILVYILIAGLFAAFLGTTLPLLADQMTQLSQNIPDLYSTVRNSLLESDNRLVRNVGARIPTQLRLWLNNDPTTEEVFDQVTRTILYANLVVRGILSTLAIFLLAYYWTQESDGIIRTILRLIPPHRRKDFRELVEHAEMKMGAYIRGQGILCLMVGATAFIAYILIDLPFALVLAIFAGIMEIIPIFGPALGAIPALLIALSMDPTKALWVVIATILIQMLENMFLLPRVMKSSMGVNPIIVLLSMVAFGSVFGFAGVLLALPLAAMLQFVTYRIVTASDGPEMDARPRSINMQPLLDESERLVRIVNNSSADGSSSFGELPESAQAEISSVVRDLHQFLGDLKNEDEVI